MPNENYLGKKMTTIHSRFNLAFSVLQLVEVPRVIPNLTNVCRNRKLTFKYEATGNVITMASEGLASAASNLPGMELFRRRRYLKAGSAQIVSCCVDEKTQKYIQHVQPMQLFLHAWQLGLSASSSPSTKELHLPTYWYHSTHFIYLTRDTDDFYHR